MRSAALLVRSSRETPRPSMAGLATRAKTPLIMLMLLLLPSAGLAWSVPGHRVIADIAWLQLSPAARARAVALLRAHPDLEQGFLAHRPAGLPRTAQDRWLFQFSGAWPDIARAYRESDPERETRFNRPRWHYFDGVLWSSAQAQARHGASVQEETATRPPLDPDPSMNIVQAIAIHQQLLADSSASDADRAVALAWLAHLVPDLHQPLHSGSMYGLPGIETRGDRGGNLICLAGLGDIGNLHWFWDSLLSGEAAMGDLEGRALQLLMSHGQAMAPRGSSGSAVEWREESAVMSALVAWPPELRTAAAGTITGAPCDQPDAGRLVLGADYIQRARFIAEQRAVLAAFRLAHVLEEALGE